MPKDPWAVASEAPAPKDPWSVASELPALSGSISGADTSSNGTPLPSGWTAAEDPNSTSNRAVGLLGSIADTGPAKEVGKGILKNGLSTLISTNPVTAGDAHFKGGLGLASRLGVGPGGSLLNTDATNPEQKLGQHVETAAELAPAAAELVPSLISKGMGMIPSAARSGRSIETITQKALGHPVPLDVPNGIGEASKPLDRISQFANNGGTMPSAPNALLNRSQSPVPIPFEDARDFYTNITNLSGDEAGKLSKPMKKFVGNLRDAYHQDLVAAAQRAGGIGENLGGQYDNAINEYRRAMQLQTAGRIGLTRVLPATGALGAIGTLGYGAYEGLKKLIQ